CSFLCHRPAPSWPSTLSLHDALPILGLAMACQRSGQTQEARQWLDKAVTWIDKAASKSAKEVRGSIPGLDSSHDWLACHILRRRSEEHTSELQSRGHLVCRLLLEKKK